MPHLSHATGISAQIGFQTYLARVYHYMAGGLAVSGASAFLGAREPLLHWLYTITPKGVSLSFLGWVVMLAPLVMIFVLNSALSSLNTRRAQLCFWTFSVLMGLSLSNIFLVYTGTSIFKAFCIAALTFYGASLFGKKTQRDLTSMGSFLRMGLIGLIIAMVVNLFMHSSQIEWAVSVIGVGVFTGLAAFDTQRLRLIYSQADTTEVAEAKSISGALALYLDFINLFLMLLHFFMGDQRK